MTRIYHDWEFVEDGKTIAPLSVALKSSNGDELYRIFRDDVAVGRAFARPWLRDRVLCHLPVIGLNDTWAWDTSHPDWVRVRTREEIAQDVRFFVSSHGPEVELWADYGAYDHVALAQLFGRMIDLPDGFPMYTNDLQQELCRMGFRESNLDLLPKQAWDTQHSALHDVRHEFEVGTFLLNWEAGGPPDVGR